MLYSSQRDFNFLFGRCHVKHRRFVTRLVTERLSSEDAALLSGPIKISGRLPSVSAYYEVAPSQK